MRGIVRRVVVGFLAAAILTGGIALGMLGALFSVADADLSAYGGPAGGGPAPVDRTIALPQDARVFDRSGALLAAIPFDDAHRTVVALAQVHPDLRDAVIASEDARFWEHDGIDPRGILRAASVIARTRGEEIQGGSTITQQLLKHFFLGDRHPVLRKAEELLLAERFERSHGKDALLELYLNAISLGHGYAGVEAASVGYFGRSASTVSLAEATLLAGMIRAPSETSPFCSPTLARQRQRNVLGRLDALGFRDARTVAARDVPIAFALGDDVVPVRVSASVVGAVEAARGLTSGVRITTPIDRWVQHTAVEALAETLRAYTVRRGEHRGPRFVLSDAERIRWHRELHGLLRTLRSWGTGFGATLVYDLRALAETKFRVCRYGGMLFRRAVPGTIVSGVVIRHEGSEAVLDLGELTGTIDAHAVAWTRQSLDAVAPVGAIVDVTLPTSLPLSRGATVAVALTPRPYVEGAVVVLGFDPLEVRAIVGGVDPRRGDLHRALAARRPIGSTMKPFVMGAGLAGGTVTASATVYDAAIRYADPWGGGVWSPVNWYRGNVGPLALTDAMGRSVNMAAVDVALETGVHRVAAFVEELSPVARVPWEPAIALGAVERTPLELALAFAVIARGGVRGQARITTSDFVAADVPVLSASVAAALDALLLQPIANPQGTARRLQSLGFPVRGKTGTTDAARDAWFVGYTAETLVAVWVGYDQPASLGTTERLESGGSLAAPVAEAVFRAAGAPTSRTAPPVASLARWGSGTSWVTRRAFADTGKGAEE